MALIFLLALQAAAPPAASPEIRPISFDLARYRAGPAECGRPTGSDILVCGRRPANGYPLDAMAKLFERGALMAETGLGGSLRGAVVVESADFPGGMRSNRLLVRVKMPF